MLCSVWLWYQYQAEYLKYDNHFHYPLKYPLVVVIFVFSMIMLSNVSWVFVIFVISIPTILSPETVHNLKNMENADLFLPPRERTKHMFKRHTLAGRL